MASISQKVIDAVMEKASIIDVVSRYTRVIQKGKNYVACCPFHHEKTPSFSITPEKNMFYCFGCHESGTVISFLSKIEKITFSDSVKQLAQECHIPYHFSNETQYYDRKRDEYYALYQFVKDLFHQNLINRPRGSLLDRYLGERSITDDIISEFKLGYAPQDRHWLWNYLIQHHFSPSFLKENTGLFSTTYPEIAFFSHRLMFPIHDKNGRCVAFGGRLLEGNGPKYLNTGTTPYFEKKNIFYTSSSAYKEARLSESAILCEGYMDVIAYNRAGITNAFAPLGTAFTEEQAQLLSQSGIKTVTISFDSDQAGIKATEKAYKILKNKKLNVKVVELSHYKDPDEYIKNEGVESLKNLLKNSINGLDFIIKNIIVKHGNLDSLEMNKAVVSEVFPYISLIETEVERESALQYLAQRLNIGEKAVCTDFNAYTKKKPLLSVKVNKPQQKNRQTKGESLNGNNREFFLFSTLLQKPQFFDAVRRWIKVEDLQLPQSKEIYYILEELFRKDLLTKECVDNKLQQSQLTLYGENPYFLMDLSTENVELLLPELIKNERVAILERKIATIQEQLNCFSTLQPHEEDVLIRKKIELENELNKIVS